jgi:hypothetical protein
METEHSERMDKDMAMNPGSPGFARPPHETDGVRKQRDIERAQRENAAARGLAASSIGAGGLIVKDGGSITIQAPGTLNVAGGALNSGGSITAVTDVTAGGALIGNTLHVINNSQIDGTENVVGILTANAGIISTDARSRTGGSSLAGLWADGSGRFQINPSSIRFKTDIEPWTTDPRKLLNVRSVLYRLLSQAEDALKQLGFIAEELLEAGFPEFIFYNTEGEVEGINYDRVVVALLELAKVQDERLTAIERRL